MFQVMQDTDYCENVLTKAAAVISRKTCLFDKSETSSIVQILKAGFLAVWFGK